MHYEYRTHGTCSSKIAFDLNEDGTIHNIVFTGGCPGNLAAIPKIVVGCNAHVFVAGFGGNDCRGRGTSCADQLTKAIVEAQKKMKE